MSNDKVKAVNDILLKGEPANISVDEHSGYTGYKPQAVVDAMNEVFWGEWGFEEISSEITPGEKGLAIAQVRVYLSGVEFKPTGWGQNRVTRGDIGDARKGAQTDAIKKALSYFSIGNRAYHGLLPDKKEQAAQARSQTANKPAQQNTAPIPQASKEQWEQIHALSEQVGQAIPAVALNIHQANNVIARLQKQIAENKDAEQVDPNRLQAEEKVQKRCRELFGDVKGPATYNRLRAHVAEKFELGDVPAGCMTDEAIGEMWNQIRKLEQKQALAKAS